MSNDANILSPRQAGELCGHGKNRWLGSAPNVNCSLRLMASASTRVEHLVRQAILVFDTDLNAARRCLSDASTLLDTEARGLGVPGVDKLQPGGLATWQARRTLAYIEVNLASKVGNDDLANVVALSRSHFCRAFKRSIGYSPMEYVGVRRVERAKAMISSTRQGLAEIALVCGFADQAHLNRRFRDIVGMSPGRWRRRNTALVAKPSPHRNVEVQMSAALHVRASSEIGRRAFR